MSVIQKYCDFLCVFVATCCVTNVIAGAKNDFFDHCFFDCTRDLTLVISGNCEESASGDTCVPASDCEEDTCLNRHKSACELARDADEMFYSRKRDGLRRVNSEPLEVYEMPCTSLLNSPVLPSEVLEEDACLNRHKSAYELSRDADEMFYSRKLEGMRRVSSEQLEAYDMPCASLLNSPVLLSKVLEEEPCLNRHKSACEFDSDDDVSFMTQNQSSDCEIVEEIYEIRDDFSPSQLSGCDLTSNDTVRGVLSFYSKPLLSKPPEETVSSGMMDEESMSFFLSPRERKEPCVADPVRCQALSIMPFVHHNRCARAFEAVKSLSTCARGAAYHAMLPCSCLFYSAFSLAERWCLCVSLSPLWKRMRNRRR